MANIIRQQTINNIQLLEVDDDPTAGAGTPANLGSMAFWGDVGGAAGRVYWKSGVADTAWTLATGGGAGPGTPNTFAAYDGGGNISTLAGWGVSTDTGGANVNLSLTPADPGGGTTFVIQDFVNTITPTNDLTNLSYQAWQNYTYLVGPNDFLNYIGLNNGVAAQEAGNHGNITLLNQTLDLGDATNASDSESSYLINQYITVHDLHTTNQQPIFMNQALSVDTGSTANGVTLFNASAQVNGDLTGNFNVFGFNANFNSSFLNNSGLNGINLNPSIFATIQYVNSFNAGFNFDAGSVITNGVQHFIDSSNVQAGGATDNGYNSFSAGPNFHAGSSLLGGYAGYSVAPTIDGTMGTNGANLFIGTGQMSSIMNFFNGVFIGPNFNSGSTIANGYNTFNDNANFQSGSSVNGVVTFGSYPNFHAGSAATSYSGFQSNPQIDIAFSGNIVIADFKVTGSGSASNLTGVNIDLGNITDSNPQGVVGLNSNGRLSVNATTDMVSAQTFQIGTRIDHLYQIPPGSPVTGTDSLGLNLAGDIYAQDDVALGPVGIGFNSVGFIASVAVSPTKTVDSITAFLPAVSLTDPGAPTGGTITDLNIIKMYAPAPSGGTAVIDNFYFMRVSSAFGVPSTVATNAWGLFVEDQDLENYIGRLAIGTGTFKVSNADVAIEVGSIKAVRFANMTTAQKNALTALKGFTVYDTDLDQLSYYNGTVWVNI